MTTSSLPNEGQHGDYLTRFLTFLTTRPAPDEICNHVVMSWPSQDAIQQAAIGQILNDGTLSFTGWFGYTHEINRVYGTTTIWDELPSSIAVRERRLFACTTRAEIEDRFPHLSKAMPDLASVIATPLISNLTPIGVCVISGSNPLQDPDQAKQVMSDYALALSLYLSAGRSSLSAVPTQAPAQPATHNNHASIPPTDFRARHTLVPNQLTERQFTVLQHLALGLTNRQIAMRIGFSESTVRQETMAIYAFFGVRGRKEAVDAALMRGMVTQDDLDDFYPTPAIN